VILIDYNRNVLVEALKGTGGVQGFSDLIDLWAIDWNYEEDQNFTPQFVSFRIIGAGRKIVEGITVMAQNRYECPGKYRIMVKVIDILGGSASIVRDLEIP